MGILASLPLQRVANIPDLARKNLRLDSLRGVEYNPPANEAPAYNVRVAETN